MELRQLEAFVAVATELHFGRAAKKLYIGQPTLSDLVRRLEREVGTPLLVRTTRRVALTSAGSELHQRAAAILDDVAAAAVAIHRFAEGDAGTVRLGVTPPVAPVLATHLASALRTAAPEIELIIRRMWLWDLQRAIADDSIDVAITCGPVPTPVGVVSEPLCGEPLLAALRPAHRLADRDCVSLADLAGDTLGMPSGDLFPAWQIAQRNALRTAGISPVAVELVDTDLSARKWPGQAEVDWILTTASLATPDMAAVIRAVTARQLVPFELHWVPGRTPNAAVNHFVQLARSVGTPTGWIKLDDELVDPNRARSA